MTVNDTKEDRQDKHLASLVWEMQAGAPATLCFLFHLCFENPYPLKWPWVPDPLVAASWILGFKIGATTCGLNLLNFISAPKEC